MEPTPPASLWDAIRSWADSAGLLAPQHLGPDGRPVPPHVPEGVCAACPICQVAATVDQLNPQILADLTIVVRSVLDGMGAALAAAAMQRTSTRTAGEPADAAGSPDPQDDGAAPAPD